MILQFNYNNEIVEINVTKRPIKNIYIKLDSKNNIVVSTPKNSSDKFILNFIEKYIEKFVNLQKANLTKSNINLEEKKFYLFGQLKSYDLEQKKVKENGVINYLIFQDKKYKINKKSISDIVFGIYKKELLEYLKTSQYHMEQLMNVEHHDISIKMKQTAWASNYIEKKKINYSTKLAAFSHEIIDYVVVHELAHAKHSNHSKEFWKIVEKFEPNFKSKKNKLKSFIYF